MYIYIPNESRTKERGIEFADAFNRFNVKKITTKQLILNVILSLVKTDRHCLLTVEFDYTKSNIERF